MATRGLRLERLAAQRQPLGAHVDHTLVAGARARREMKLPACWKQQNRRLRSGLAAAPQPLIGPCAGPALAPRAHHRRTWPIRPSRPGAVSRGTAKTTLPAW
eukprot:scaffold23375_cov59-Phaeocystis_antarctica.AAC.4